MGCMPPTENGLSAQELKDVMQDLALAAGGCMKPHPSHAQRARLRCALVRALKALKLPVKEERAVEALNCGEGNSNSEDSPERVPWSSENSGNKTKNAPDQLIARYVEQGGDWQALIAAITRRGRSGQTKREYLTSSQKREKNHETTVQREIHH